MCLTAGPQVDGSASGGPARRSACALNRCTKRSCVRLTPRRETRWNCYVCDTRGQINEAVAICHHCGAALCTKHLDQDLLLAERADSPVPAAPTLCYKPRSLSASSRPSASDSQSLTELKRQDSAAKRPSWETLIGVLR